MSRAALRSRLRALRETLQPYDSLAARVERLPPYLRAEYERWRSARPKLDYSGGDGEAYERSLAGPTGPRLRSDVCEALDLISTDIPADATTNEASELYRAHVQVNKWK